MRTALGTMGVLAPSGAEESWAFPSSTPGPSLSCFHWPRGVQACARLQQLLEWTRNAGFGEAAERFFLKLSCTLNLLATPRAQLIQVRGAKSSGAGSLASTPGRGVWPQRTCRGSTVGPTCSQDNGPKDVCV